MDHVTFVIGIVETKHSISDRIKGCEPGFGYTQTVVISETLDGLSGNNCCAIVMDKIPGSKEIETLNSPEFTKLSVLIIPDDATLEDVPEEIAECVYDVCPASLSDRAFASFYRHYLDYLCKSAKLWLYENYLDSVINLIPDLVWFKDLQGAHVKVNDAFCKACGKKKSDVQGKGHAYIWDVDEEEFERGENVCKETDTKVITTKEIVDNEELVQCDKGLRQFHTRKAPLLTRSGDVFGTVGIANDITDIKNMDSEIKVILGNLPFATLVKDIDDHIISVNNKFCEYFSTDAVNMSGKLYELWENYHLPDLAAFSHLHSYEHSVQLKGSNRMFQITKEPLLNMFDMVSGYIYIFFDVTRERNYQQRILKLANTDYLTELYNRRYLYEFLNLNRTSNDIVFYYIDLDNFKNINDKYGHKVGDDVLCILSHVMKETFPGGVCFRLGGDEFAVVMLNMNSIEEAEGYAERTLRGIENRFRAIEHIPDITGSIGIVFNPPAEISIDDLIRRADQALYKAKNLGKNRYCFWSSDTKQF